MRRGEGILFCHFKRSRIQHFFHDMSKLLCLEVGFRLKVIFFCDSYAFRRKMLSALQMACSCCIWQEGRKVSKPWLSLVSYSKLVPHFDLVSCSLSKLSCVTSVPLKITVSPEYLVVKRWFQLPFG